MDETEYNTIIEKMSQILTSDNISSDEQNPEIISKYETIAKTKFKLDDEKSRQLVFESLLYLKMKSTDSIDPLQQGDQFGAGFS